MNTDEILTYSLGPKARAQNNQEHFKELQHLDFDADLRPLFSDAPMNNTGYTTAFERRASDTRTVSSLTTGPRQGTQPAAFRTKTSI